MGFGVWGLGFGFRGLGFRIWGLGFWGFMVVSLGLRVRVQGLIGFSGCEVQGVGLFQILAVWGAGLVGVMGFQGFRVQFKVQGPRHPPPNPAC